MRSFSDVNANRGSWDVPLKNASTGMLVASALVLSGCSSSGGKLGDIASIAPENSTLIFAFDGLDDMVGQLGEMMENLGEVAAYLPPGATEEIAEGLLGATAAFGFDPTSPKAFAEIGLDLSRPVSSIMVLPDTSGDSLASRMPTQLMTLPVSDQEAFQDFITTMTDSGIQEQEIGDETFYFSEQLGSGWMYKNKNLVGYSPMPWEDPAQTQLDFAAMMGSDASLKDNESFKKMAKAMGKNWSLMAWADASMMTDSDFREFQQLAGVQSMGFHISEKKSTASLNVVVHMDDEAPAMQYLKAVDGASQDVLSEQLSGSPIAVARMSIDAPAMLEIARAVPSMQEGLVEMTRELASEGLLVDQIVEMLPSSLGAAAFFNAMGSEFWIGGEMGEDTTALPILTAAMAQDCDSSRRSRKQTLQPIPNGLACLTDRRGEFEMIAMSEDLAAMSTGVAFLDSTVLQTQIVGRLMGIGNDEGYGDGLSKDAQKALNAKGMLTAYVDVGAGLRALAMMPDVAQELGPMGAVGLGMLANQFTEGLHARVWVDGPLLNGSASISLEELDLGAGGSTAAVMGVMAAVAIPNFIEMQLKAKRAEIPSNVKALKEAQEIFNSENDRYLYVSQHPRMQPGKDAVSWESGNSGFNNLNWHPDGKVRGVYSVTTTATSRRTPGGDFKVIGISDIDGDGVYATYTATKSINVRMITPNSVY